MNPYIVLDKLFISYGNKEIIRGIDLKLDLGEFVSLVGSNGTGKTTLGKAILGLVPIAKGDIRIDKTSIKDLSLADLGKKIGYLFQNPSKQIFAPRVYDELSFAMRFKGVDEVTIEKKVVEMLNTFDIAHLKNQVTFTLSQGEKQRLALATIFLNDPSYLVLDEPTTGLDSVRAGSLGNLLKSLLGKVGILMISHDKAFVNSHSHRVLTIKDGRIDHV